MLGVWARTVSGTSLIIDLVASCFISVVSALSSCAGISFFRDLGVSSSCFNEEVIEVGVSCTATEIEHSSLGGDDELCGLEFEDFVLSFRPSLLDIIAGLEVDIFLDLLK